MKKTFGVIFMLLFLSLGIVSFVLLNLRLTVLNEKNAKQIVEDSNFRNVVSAYIKDSIISKTDFQINEGTNFEDLNVAVNKDTVTDFSNDTVDKFFSAINDPKPDNLVFPVAFDSPEINGKVFHFAKTVNLNNNLIFALLSRINQLIFLAFGVALIFLLFAILMFSSDLRGHIKTVGGSFITLAILLSIFLVFFIWWLPGFANTLVVHANFVKESKLINGAQNLLDLIVSRQLWFYISEIIILFVLGFLSLFSSEILSKHKIDRIEEKI